MLIDCRVAGTIPQLIHEACRQLEDRFAWLLNLLLHQPYVTTHEHGHARMSIATWGSYTHFRFDEVAIEIKD